MAKRTIEAGDLVWVPGDSMENEATVTPIPADKIADRVSMLRRMVVSHQKSLTSALRDGNEDAARSIVADLSHCLELLSYAKDGFHRDENAVRRNNERHTIRRAIGARTGR